MRAPRQRARRTISILGLTALLAATLQVMAVPAAYAVTIVTDEFANLSAWTATRITVDSTIGSPAAPSARAAVTAQSASAWRNLPTSTMTPCMSANINRTSGAADLLRMRTAANGAVIKAVVLTNGNLQLRSDFGSTTINSNVPIGTGWHNVELCGTVGTNTTWNLFRDGTEIVSDWVANTGTAPVGRIQIGDTAAKTFTINWDHVILDEAPGDGATGDTTPPGSPGTPSGNSPSAGLIQIGWTAATDPAPASLPITYRVFEVVGGNNNQIGTTTNTSFTHTGLIAGSSHSYRVQAVDAATNVGPLSPASASITVTSSSSTGQPKPGHTRIAWDVPRTNTPLVTTGDITDLEYIGNRVFVAGGFTTVQNRGTNNTTYNQPALFAFNLDTGLFDTNFRPTFNGGARVQEIEASPDGTKLFIVGTFNTVNGVTKRKVASINPVTGATVLGFTADANNQALSVDATNTTVYVGGMFTTINGVPRGALAAVSATTGQLVQGFVNNITGGIGTNGTLRVHALVLTHDEAKLLVVHTGRQINGQDRYGMGLIDTQTNQLLPWRSRLWDDNLQFVGGVTRIVAGAIAPDDSYFVVSSGAGGDRPPISDTIVAYPMEGGDFVEPLWISRMYDSVYSLAVSEVAVYAGGHFNYNESPTAPDPWPGLDNVGYGRGQGLAGYGLGDDVVIRDHVGAVDPVYGKSMDWNPGSNSYEGNQAMLVMPRGIVTGGDGNTQGMLNGGRIAVYDFNSVPAVGNNDSVIINPIEGRVEESDVEFVVDGTATATSGVQRVEVMLRERDTQQYLQDNMTWGNASNTINANLAAPGATSTSWSLPLTISDNHRILLYSRTFGNNGTSEVLAARPLQRIETFGVTDQTPTTNITGPNTSVIPTQTFTVTGTAVDDFGVNSVRVYIRDPQQRYLQGDGTAQSNYNTFTIQPDVVGATSATWSWEVTVPYEGEWEAGAIAVDTEGQADLREGVRSWIVSDTAAPPTVDIATPAVMIPPVTIPALTMAPGSPVTFSGSATDDEGLHDVTITLRNTATGENLAADGTWGVNVNAGSHLVSPLDVAGTSYNWSYTTPFNLTSGTYVFSVSATDDLGLNTSNANRGSLTINVQVPGDAFPDVTINPTGTINGVQVLHLDLAGAATDDIGVSAVRVRIEEDDRGLYLQPNGLLSAAIAYLDATLANPGGTSTAWTLSVDLPVEGDYRVTVVAWDTSNQQDPSTTGATSRYPIYPGDAPPTVTENIFAPVEGTEFTDGRIFVSGRVEDDQQIAQAHVAIRNALGQWMGSSGAFTTSANPSWRNAFLNSPGSPGSNFSYTTPVIPPGSYTVFARGQDQNGFTTLVPIERNVTVTGSPTSLPPVANFTYSCVENVCSFDGRSSTDETIPTLTYSWNFGNGSGSGPVPIRTYTSPGTFTVILTVRDENGLSGVTSQLVTIVEPAGNLPPVPVISPPVCTARTCNFSSASSTDPNPGDGNPSRLWNWGDGTATSTATSTSHTYAADGMYTVTLTVTDGWGDFQTASVVVTIAEPAGNQPPTAVISAPVCTGRTCNFFGTASSDPNGDALTYSWNWGDGTAASTGATPAAHTFAANQAYTVTLTVTDAWSDVGTDTEVVTFSIPAGNQPPNVVIGTPSCVVRTCTLPSAGSSDPNGDSFTYSWTWGDATAITTTAIGSHTYAADNTYLVRLTLTDVWGAVAFAEVSVTVGEPAGNLPPTPVIATPVCTARTCAFSATGSTDPDGDAFTYLWNWGDGTATSTATSPSHTFLVDGTYTVSLTLTDAWGDAATVTRDVTITEPATNVAPVPIINPVTCVVRTCTLYGVSSYEPNSDAFTYLWNFGDGTTSTLVSPSKTFAADGTYTVTLTVTDAWGDAASTTREVVIGEPAGNLPPVPVINAPSCVALACSLSSVGTVDPNGDTMTFAWNWGDGTANSTTANASHTFAAAGTYTVTLTVTDGWGDAATVTRDVTITEPPGNLPPNPVIVDPPSCVGLVCTFSSAGSVEPNGDGFTRVWSWGDGTPNTTSTTVTQAHTFAAPGTYTVTLTLTDWWGDAATDTLVVTVA